LEILIQATLSATPPCFGWHPPTPRGLSVPRASRGQGLSDRARRSRFASSAGVETGGSGPSPRVARFVYPVKTRRMGWDSNPRTTFAVAGFQGRRSQSGHSRRDHPWKQRQNASGAVLGGQP